MTFQGDPERCNRGVSFKSIIMSITLLMCFVSGRACFALDGWSEIFNLATGTRAINDAAMDVNNESVYVIFESGKLEFTYSDTNGKLWSEPVTIVEPLDFPQPKNPSLLYTESTLHCVWSAPITSGNEFFYQLFYTKSEDEGLTWSEPKRISRSISHSLRPQLIAIPGGFAILWFEFERREVILKKDLDFGLLDEYISNPSLALIPLESYDIVRSSIVTARTFNNGGSFEEPRRIREVLGPITVFSSFRLEDGALGLMFDEKMDTLILESKDEGANWSENWRMKRQVPNRTLVDQTSIGNGRSARIIAPFDPYKPVPLEVQIGTDTKKQIATNVVLQSYPRISFAGEDIHLMWVQLKGDEALLKYVRTDRNPPTTEIVSPDGPDIKTPRFGIEWQGLDDISSRVYYAHSLDKLNWSSWEEVTGLTIKTPEDGEYDFYLTSKDLANNVQREPTHFHFNTYSVAPDTFFVGTSPSKVHSRSTSFAWDGVDNNPGDSLLFSYKLDSEEWTQFLPQKEVTFQNLTEGSHTIQVRAKDESDNIDETVAQSSFSVILNLVPKFVTFPEPLTSNNTMALQWDAEDDTTDNAKFLFSYQLDDGLWSGYSPIKEVKLTDLKEGRHQVFLRARDEQGNVSKETAEVSFVVDLTPPSVDIALQKRDSSTGYKPLIELQGEDNISAGKDVVFQYRHGEGDWSEWTSERIVTIDEPVKMWSKGYKVYVRARDKAGNVSEEPAEYSLLLLDRYPIWLLILPVAIVALVIVVVLLGFIKSRLSAMKRRKAASSQNPPIKDVDFSASADFETSGDEDDLFE